MTVMLFSIWEFLYELHSDKLRENFNNILEVLLDIWKLSIWNQLDYTIKIFHLFIFIINKE